jgi:hypothetical protein
MTSAVIYLGTAPAGGPLDVQLQELAQASALQVLATCRDDLPPDAPLEQRLGLCRALAWLRPSHTLLAEEPAALAPVPSPTAQALAVELAHRRAHVLFSKNGDHACGYGGDVNDALSRLRKGVIAACRLNPCDKRVDRVPYGYGRDKSRRVLVRDVEEQAIVKTICAWHKAGKRLPEIGRMLRQEGIAPRGRAWHANTIRRILMRAGYSTAWVQ